MTLQTRDYHAVALVLQGPDFKRALILRAAPIDPAEGEPAEVSFGLRPPASPLVFIDDRKVFLYDLIDWFQDTRNQRARITTDPDRFGAVVEARFTGDPS